MAGARLCRMGTHPSAPSLVTGSGQTLSDWLAQHPAALGKATTERFGADLPFLFKVKTVIKCHLANSSLLQPH